nr:6-bladed beta-propeller [uncultured Draconibacterium sp.]
MKKLISFLAIIALFSCNESQKAKDIVSINLENFQAGKILLSEIGNDIKYIPFENQFPIGTIYSYKITNNFIYAAIKDVGVVRFSKNGKSSSQFGKIGRGPSEYVSYSRFAVDHQNGCVYVLDRKTDNINVYNKDGEYTQDIKLPVDEDGFGFDDIGFLSSSIFLAQYINMGRGEYDWLILDSIGNRITGKLNPYHEFNGRMGGMSTLSEFNGDILYWDNFKDTVFHIHPDFTYSPLCVLLKGKHKFPMTTEGYNPPDEFFKHASNYMILYTVLETNQSILLQYELNRIQKLALIDKESGTATVTDLTDSINGIINDIDNGLPFLPEKYFEIGNEKYLTTFIQPFELKKNVASNEFKNATPKYPEKKKELVQLANSLNENDNPVLMLVKLKE